MTIGLSPKVALPAIVLTIIGAALLVAGDLLGDMAVAQAGLAVLGAAGVGGAIGYRAQPGNVAPVANPGKSNDELLATALDAEQREQLGVG